MSKVREVVEWGFNEIVKNWKYLDFKCSMKIFEAPIGKYYIIGDFLSNLRTSFYENQINLYFECQTMDLNDYLSLID